MTCLKCKVMLRPFQIYQNDAEVILSAQVVWHVHETGGSGLGDAIVDDDEVILIQGMLGKKRFMFSLGIQSLMSVFHGVLGLQYQHQSDKRNETKEQEQKLA